MHLGFFLRIWVQNRECFWKVYSHTSTPTQFTPLPCKQLCQHRHSPVWGTANSWVKEKMATKDSISSSHPPKLPHFDHFDSLSQSCAIVITLQAATNDSNASIVAHPCGPLHMVMLYLAQEASGQEQSTSHLKGGGQGRLHTLPKKTVGLFCMLIKMSQRYLPNGDVLLYQDNLMPALVACSLPCVCTSLLWMWTNLGLVLHISIPRCRITACMKGKGNCNHFAFSIHASLRRAAVEVDLYQNIPFFSRLLIEHTWNVFIFMPQFLD